MKIYYLIIIIIIGLFLQNSCNDKNNPVSPDDKPYRSGLPLWDNPEYDWIDSSYLIWSAYPKDSKFALSVYDCSPDGNNLIVQDLSNNKILFFNTNSKTFDLLLNANIINADWNKNGKLIGFGLVSYVNKNEIYCIFNNEIKNYFFVSIPDTFKYVSGTFKWWKSDSTFLTTLMTPYDKISHRYLVNINAPNEIQIREDLNYDFEPYNNFRYCITYDSLDKLGLNYHSYLEIKNESNVTIEKYLLPDIITAYPLRISPNGRYLAILSGADIRNTNRYRPHLEYFGGLLIIDLQNLSPENIIYRFFPDYTNSYRGQFYAYGTEVGAWSSDSKYFYHKYSKEDSTVQIVKRNIYTSNIEFLTDLKAAP